MDEASVPGGITYPPEPPCGLGRALERGLQANPALRERVEVSRRADLLQRLAKALKVALAILTLMLAACATPATLRQADPNREGVLPGDHGRLARCALTALEETYPIMASAGGWVFTLREYPAEARTDLVAITGSFVTVVEFRQDGDKQVRVRAWSNSLTWDLVGTAWAGAETCGQ